MKVPPKINIAIYGIIVFVIFQILVAILKLVTHKMPAEADYLGLFTNKDLQMGALIAILLTIIHVRKKKLNQ